MSLESFLKLAPGSTIEEFARDVYLKSNLTTEVCRALKVLHLQHANEKKVLVESPAVAELCSALEAIFLHGLKDKFSVRISVFIRTTLTARERAQSIDFWQIVLILCHNNICQELEKLANIATDVGRCRAWLRLVINDGTINSYLESLMNDTSLLHGFYRSSAYLRDREHTDLLKQLLEGLDSIEFDLKYDISSMNFWSQETLKLIGISGVADIPLPVMPAEDAISLIGSGQHQIKKSKKTITEKENVNSNLPDDKSITSDKVRINYESGFTLLHV